MKKFKFRLEAVLVERKRQEDLKLREWVQASRALEGLNLEKAKFQESIHETIKNSNELTEKTLVSSGQLIAINKFLSGTHLRIQWKDREIERGQKLVEKKRLEYLKASQKRKTLEKLKEKQLEAFSDKVQKAEQRTLDDLYIMRAAMITDEETV